jgi:hypothetical protein
MNGWTIVLGVLAAIGIWIVILNANPVDKQ